MVSISGAFAPLLRGALAGAAGTTALNAVTYADMAVRGRPASTLPERAVDELTQEAGVSIPGSGADKDNRREGLAPLLGIATGIGVGAAAGVLRPLLTRLPLVVGGVVVGALAMAGSDLPMKAMGLTNPSDWSATDWAADAVPHAAYGLVTVLTLRHLG